MRSEHSLSDTGKPSASNRSAGIKIQIRQRFDRDVRGEAEGGSRGLTLAERCHHAFFSHGWLGAGREQLLSSHSRKIRSALCSTSSGRFHGR